MMIPIQILEYYKVNVFFNQLHAVMQVSNIIPKSIASWILLCLFFDADTDPLKRGPTLKNSRKPLGWFEVQSLHCKPFPRFAALLEVFNLAIYLNIKVSLPRFSCFLDRLDLNLQNSQSTLLVMLSQKPGNLFIYWIYYLPQSQRLWAVYRPKDIKAKLHGKH